MIGWTLSWTLYRKNKKKKFSKNTKKAIENSEKNFFVIPKSS